MGYISSINFKKSNPIHQTMHNDRTLSPSYLIGGDCEVNYTFRDAQKLSFQMITNAIEAYTKHTGQKFKAKSYEWSAVCNIKPETTMQDLEQLAKHFNEKYGFQCYQIAIHRDEGHINEQGQKEINHHAHLEFITLDKETGKNNYRRELITPSVLRQIQTEVAQILQMQRGEDKRKTKRKRIEPRQYAQMKEEEKRERKELAKELQRAKEDIVFMEEHLEKEKTKFREKLQEFKDQTLTQKEIKDCVEAFRKQSIGKGYPKEFFRELSNLKQNTKEATLEDLKNIIEDLTKSYEREKTKREELKEHNTSLVSSNKVLEAANQKLREENKELKQELEQLKEREKELIENLERKKDEIIEKLIKENEKLKINSLESDLKAKEQKKEENYQENKQIDLKGNSEPLNDIERLKQDISYDAFLDLVKYRFQYITQLRDDILNKKAKSEQEHKDKIRALNVQLEHLKETDQTLMLYNYCIKKRFNNDLNKWLEQNQDFTLSKSNLQSQGKSI